MIERSKLREDIASLEADLAKVAKYKTTIDMLSIEDMKVSIVHDVVCVVDSYNISDRWGEAQRCTCAACKRQYREGGLHQQEA